MRDLVLYVTTYDPQRSDLGGAAWVDRRILSQIQVFAETQTLAICNPGATWDIPLSVRSSTRKAGLTGLRMLFFSEPYITAKLKVGRGIERLLSELRRRSGPSTRIVTSQYPALYFLREAGVAVDLHVAHNVDYILARAHDPRPFTLLHNSSRTKAAEQALLAYPRQVACLSRNDAIRLDTLGIPTVHLPLSCGADRGPTAQAATGQIQCETVIGFLGKADWPPNLQAIEALVGPIRAQLRARLGSRCPLILLAGAGTERWVGVPGVRALGRLPDVEDFYNRVTAVVLPRFGETTGVSVKLLEAEAHGVTVIAPESLLNDAGIERSAAAAETPAEIVDAVLQLMNQQPVVPDPPNASSGRPPMITLLKQALT